MSEEARKAAREKTWEPFINEQAPLTTSHHEYERAFDHGWNAHADHTAAIREKAIENVIKATEESACSCSVCGVIKGESRGCYAYRAAKGHEWKYIVHLQESDVQALKAALEGNDAK